MKNIEEENIRPENLFSDFLEKCAEDAENFFDKNKFHEIPCPACGHTDIASEFHKHSFRYVECSKCFSLYSSPRPSLDELSRYYSNSESSRFWVNQIIKKTKKERNESILLPNVKRIGELFPECAQKNHKIIDIGASSGAFLQGWKTTYPKAELYAVEPSNDGAQSCRELGAITLEGVIEDVADEIEQTGDIVSCFEVIEHVHDPLAFAKAILKVVAPNGKAIITGLGVEGFDIQLLWEKSRSIMPPHHLNFLSTKGIESAFLKAGFSKVEIFTPGRLDVDIVEHAVNRGEYNYSTRFEKLLMSKAKKSREAFQDFLAKNELSSHIWAICHR